MSVLFGGFEIMFSIMFLLVSGLIIAAIVRGIMQWHKNNQAPRLSVRATVVAKRSSVTSQNQPNGGDFTGAHGYHTTTSTTYHVTFQVASGDRMELCVNGSEYAMLSEGDAGILSFQGTRYLSFERV